MYVFSAKMQEDIHAASEILWLYLFVRFHIFFSGRHATVSSEEKTSRKWQIDDLNWDQYKKASGAYEIKYFEVKCKIGFHKPSLLFVTLGRGEKDLCAVFKVFTEEWDLNEQSSEQALKITLPVSKLLQSSLA